MKNKMILKMPRTESEGGSGINNANIETFKNSPIKSLTKEELQNSSDNRIGGAKEVVVEFSEFYLKADELPDIEHLKSVLHDDKEYWDNYLKKDKKTIKFFDEAISILSKDKIRCLRISDSNTTGLLGVKVKESSPWRNLVIKSEVSDKSGSAGGSFGIGKSAAFANTDLRLVFYNTLNDDDEEAFQGVIKLPAYTKNDTNYEGTGYFSQNTDDIKKEPVYENYSLDSSYRRTKVGMDKFIVGFNDKLNSEELKNGIIASSVDNFLYAFLTGMLKVKYDDLVVNKDNIEEVIESHKELLDGKSIQYYNTYFYPDKHYSISVMEEDDVDIFVKLDANYSRRAAVVRGNGMKVFDMGYISSRIGFAALIVLKSERINAYFKDLENPEHSGWAFDRADNEKEARQYQKIIKDSLSQTVKEMHRGSLGGDIDADGMNEYLPYTYTHGKKNKMEGLSIEVEKTKKAKNRKIKKTTSEEIMYKEDEMGNIDEYTVEVNTDPEGHGGGGTREYPGADRVIDPLGDDDVSLLADINGDFVSKNQISSELINYKYVHNEDVHLLKIVSKQKIDKGFMSVFISGETTTLPATLHDVYINDEKAEYLNNRIKIKDIEAEDKLEISFGIKEEGDWSLEVEVHES